MKIQELLEARDEKKLVVIYGGRFQPFHLGHYGCYKWLCKKFGSENVWLATSNKTNFKESEGDVSPFTFSEKVEIITTLYDIKPRRIVQCKNPAFKPSEVFQLYKGYQVVYVAATGTKDHDRYSKNKYFTPLPKSYDVAELETANDRGYYVIVPTKVPGVTGTAARAELLAAEGAQKEKLFKKFFGAYDDVIADLVIAKLKDVK